jgi:tripartite-type tricarboxylate transporter receptor subunit TctC
VAESGYPKFEVVGWYGIFVPAKTPKVIVNQLAEAIRLSLSDKDLLSRLSKDGAIPIGSNPAEFNQFFQNDKAQWQKIASKLHISLD